MTVEFKNYAEYINKYCPDCEENLLTETCIDNVLSYNLIIREMPTALAVRIADFFNKYS